MIEKSKDEKGMVIIEASIVFPVMFFVLFFLIYMGNMFFMRSKMDNIVSLAAIKGAAYCSDPLLMDIEEEGKIPDKITSVQPYRHFSGMHSVESLITEEIEEKLSKVGVGFFKGMNPHNIDYRIKYRHHVFYASFTVEVEYNVTFPIRFLGSEEPTVLYMRSKTVAPVTDTADFISTVDMALDYYESTGLAEKVNEAIDSVKKFLGMGSFK